MFESALSLGSNQGDRLTHLTRARKAIAALAQTRLLASSHVYETEPVDVPPQWRADSFLNAVVIVETTLPADLFSRLIHEIEAHLGRLRPAARHAPRAIDIDIIYFGDLTSTRSDLRLPHPEWSQRRFVCAPLAEMRPELILPEQTRSVGAILATLPPTPVVSHAATQWPA